MVKFKSRYLLVETLYEGEMNQPFDGGKISVVLKNQVESLFGDIGLGKLIKNLQVKYMNNYTNLLIIRVGKEHLKMLWSALGLINDIEGVKTRMHVIGISGTIKRCEMKAKKHLERWMSNYELLKNNSINRSN
jgi:RNase P/RNase MRP subunit POP5